MKDEFQLLAQLSDEESDWWEGVIQDYRRKFVRNPKDYALEIIKGEGVSKEQLTKDTESYLEILRESVWQKYLIDEGIFHTEVITYLVRTRDLPRSILASVIKNEILSLDVGKLSEKELSDKITEVVGNSAGRIMPYLYQLSLSTTQSRRSRAGKVFEEIIETFFDIFEYPYSNQSALGNAAYNVQNLGKKVDLIVPNVESYLSNRPKCAVITMKTTLRERWQEVAEELNRTNVPHIYLLTVDPSVTPSTASIMKQYNITLVLYKKDKENRFSEFSNVMDYETFFLQEIPHIVSYWKNL